MAGMVKLLEYLAARAGCVVDTGAEAVIAWLFRGYAVRYAAELSACALSYFGIS